MGTTLRFATAPTMPHMVPVLFVLHRPLPAGNYRLLRPRDSEFSGRCVLGERGPCAERRAPAHSDRRDELRVRADEDVVLDDSAVLVRAVVIAHDRTRADVDVAPHLGVADVRKMVRFGARPDAACLHLHEIAQVYAVSEAVAHAG